MDQPRCQSCRFKGAARYEDALARAQGKIRRRSATERKRSILRTAKVFDQQRGEALKRTTELQREIRAISPFARRGSVMRICPRPQLIEALHNHAADSGQVSEREGGFETAVLNGSQRHGSR